MTDKNKVVVIGLDCMAPELVFDRWLDELPNIKRLIDTGIYGPIESSIPPITVPAWTTLATSKNPGKLGFFGFRNRPRSSYTDIEIANIIKKEVDLTPKGINDRLQLRRPIFQKTSAYGHFGRSEKDFTWEKLDLVNVFKKYL